MKQLTLAYVIDNNKILLGFKKRGFGQGWWNGFGGKVEDGEQLESAVIRELREEAGLEALAISLEAIFEFRFEQEPGKVLQVHVFKVNKWQGDVTESEEMKPQWFDLDALPYETMWPDDRLWMPLFFLGQKLRGQFLFDVNHQVIDYTLKEVKNFD